MGVFTSAPRRVPNETLIVDYSESSDPTGTKHPRAIIISDIDASFLGEPRLIRLRVDKIVIDGALHALVTLRSMKKDTRPKISRQWLIRFSSTETQAARMRRIRELRGLNTHIVLPVEMVKRGNDLRTRELHPSRSDMLMYSAHVKVSTKGIKVKFMAQLKTTQDYLAIPEASFTLTGANAQHVMYVLGFEALDVKPSAGAFEETADAVIIQTVDFVEFGVV
jgi:hypothetical protein